MKSKKRGIIILTIILLFGVLVGFTVVVGLGKHHKGSAGNIKLGLDLKGGVSITYEVLDKDFTKTEFEDTKNKIQKRIESYDTEADVYGEGDNRITLDIPGATNVEEVLERVGRPGTLYFATPYSGDEVEGIIDATDEYGMERKFKVWVDGTQVQQAKGASRPHETTGKLEYIVELQFDSTGREAFRQATSEFLGQSIYIIYDNATMSFPTVQSVISDGVASITGMESFEAAENLASTIRIGSLTLELKQISSRVVGAKLGSDAISTSLFAGLIGFIIVALFMCFVYRGAGFASVIALALYTGLILLVLNGFDLTLTLPGIAGVILSIGMAMDANVIIFARIREELATGKSVESSIKIGFKKALSVIIDSNVTTLIVALILMWQGSGPVKGFANTLAIGIILSMFTAVTITQFLIEAFYSLGLNKAVYYGVQKPRKTIDFVGKRAITFVIPVILIVAGFVVMLVYNNRGEGAFNLSIEFQGGTSTTVEFDKDYSIDEFNNEIKPKLIEAIGDTEIHGQKISGGNEYVIKTKDLDAQNTEKMNEILVGEYNVFEDSIDTMFISASISDEMTRAAIIAVVIALICMLLYIWFRFKDFNFATSTVIALVHDVLIALAFYAVSRITVGNTFIAVMLTILAYSINSTIVIFDRIRENLTSAAKKADMAELVNSSITQTLTRNIYTTITTLAVVIMLYIFGVTAIKEFVLPLIVGFIGACFSSVCITAPLWYTMSKRKYEKRAAK